MSAGITPSNDGVCGPLGTYLTQERRQDRQTVGWIKKGKGPCS